MDQNDQRRVVAALKPVVNRSAWQLDEIVGDTLRRQRRTRRFVDCGPCLAGRPIAHRHDQQNGDRQYAKALHECHDVTNFPMCRRVPVFRCGRPARKPV